MHQPLQSPPAFCIPTISKTSMYIIIICTTACMYIYIPVCITKCTAYVDLHRVQSLKYVLIGLTEQKMSSSNQSN